MGLQKIGIKIFVREPLAVGIREFVPVFHRWIQGQVLPDHLLVDVADYTHVPGGPAALLVAHEANLCLDLMQNRPGLFYYRKQSLNGEARARLRGILRTALQACRLLESDEELAGRVTFRTDEFLVVANDRLLAPNDEASFTALCEDLELALRDVFEGSALTFCREIDPKARLMITVGTSSSLSLDEILQRLG